MTSLINCRLTQFVIHILIYYNIVALAHSSSLIRFLAWTVHFVHLARLSHSFSLPFLSSDTYGPFSLKDIHDSYEVLLSISRVPIAVHPPAESRRTVSRRRRRFVPRVTIINSAVLPLVIEPPWEFYNFWNTQLREHNRNVSIWTISRSLGKL